MHHEVTELIQMSNHYGSSPDYVLAGGGNTSVKVGPTLYVKGSGTKLATLKPDDLVTMDRDKLAKMLDTDYPDTDAEREAAALTDLMAARLPQNGEKRPSVETLLHNLFPQKYVLHVHPALVNGLTCSQGAEARAREILGQDFVWIPIYRPGYALAVLCEDKLKEHKKAHGKDAQVILLQNHGIFVAADTVEEIDRIMSGIMKALSDSAAKKPRREPSAYDEETVQRISNQIASLLSGDVAVEFAVNPDVLDLLSSRENFKPLDGPFTPDHIVYCKAEFLYVESPDDLKGAIEKFINVNEYEPHIFCIRNIGIFAAAASAGAAETALSLALDAVTIAVYAYNFGGYLHMTDELVKFIRNWEVESYRSKVSGS